MRRSRLLAGVAVAASAALTLPAAAQTVDVTLTNPSGNRVVTVEDMTGSALSSLDFGKNRELPFRVKVQDTDYARSDFSVSATMTNLYVDSGTALDYTKKIGSSDVSLGSQTNPLNVLNLTATVQPVVGTVTQLVDSTICNTLGLVATVTGSCTLSTTGLTGKVIDDLTLTVDSLTDLPNLPIVPQQNEQAAFTDPSYATGTAGELDPAKTTTAATQRRLVAGGTNLSPVLTELDAALAPLALDALVNSDAVVADLRSQHALLWDLLTAAEVQSILAAADAIPTALTAADVLSLTGTYMSLPTLKVNVPTDAAAGSYKGTMVVTSMQ